MITDYAIERYGPIQRVNGRLTPLHAFIGPNDSGKSSLLKGLLIGMSDFDDSQYWSAQKTRVRVGFDAEGFVGVTLNGAVPLETGLAMSRGNAHWFRAADLEKDQWIKRGSFLARFEADSLRQPSPLFPESQAMRFVEQRGLGIPAIYDALNNRNDDSLKLISEEMRGSFPTVERVRLQTLDGGAKLLAVVLHDGTEVPATHLSEGMLYYLAYAALRRLSGVALLAVEEPETGLHPSRIADVVRILRAISESGTQVVLATHSPLVINELQAHEVSVVTRTKETGTQVRLLNQTPNFEERSRVYALGELWLSYANGIDEAPLLKGDAPTAVQTK